MEKPLSPSIRLAGNPTQPPRYVRTARLQDGTSLQVADPSATRALVALMDMQAQMGGAASHFGGPSAFAELMASAHALMFHWAAEKKRPWYEGFHFVNDAGHCENGLYALKALYGFADLTIDSLKPFRSIKSKLSGHGEMHLFPEGVYVSNGPLGSGLPQAQGLALADGLTQTQRVTVAAISDGGCMEGEAREALAAIPGLAAKGKLAPFVMIISDNNTKLSGRIDKDAFSMAPTFAALADLGWDVMHLENGHDLQACVTALETALSKAKAHPNRPVAIHAKTIKGYGTKKTAESSSGAHGFPLKDPAELRAFITEIYAGEPVPEEFWQWADAMVDEHQKKTAAKAASASTRQLTAEKVQVGISRAMIRMREQGHPVVSISSDLPGSTGVAEFQKKFPEVTQDVGVAEANMVSTAIGLSKEGFIPVVDTFSQFGVTKGGLPLIMAALSQGPMICVFSHAGFQDAADGASHQALSYIAMVSSIPYTDVYVLTSSSEADALMEQAIQRFAEARRKGEVPHSVIFFLGRENFPPSYMADGHIYRMGEAQVVFDNTAQLPGKVTIVAAGPMLHEALQAAYTLENEKLGCVVVNPSVINKPDLNTIRSCLRNTDAKLLTVEDHQVVGGMGSILIHALTMAGIPFRAQSLGVKGEFGQSAYKASELYRRHGIDALAIAAEARKLASL